MDKRIEELQKYIIHQLSKIDPDWTNEKIQAHMMAMRAVLERKGYSNAEIFSEIQLQALQNIIDIMKQFGDDFDG